MISGGSNFTDKTLPFSCPVCARVTDYPIHILVEDARLSCAFCKVKLRLHGHMLEYVQKEISKMKGGNPAGGAD